MNSKTNEMLFALNLCPVSSNHHLIVHLPAALTSPMGHMTVLAEAAPKWPRARSAGVCRSATQLLLLEQQTS